MNIEKEIKEELLEAAENTKGAEAFVLLIGYDYLLKRLEVATI